MVTGQRSSSGCLLDEQLLLGGPAGEPQCAPLLGVEPHSPELLLDMVGQGQIDVVTPQHQVVAHGNPAEAWASGGLDHGDQAEVGCSAADIADQDQLAGPNLALPAILVRDDPAIERRLRLLQQGDRGELGFPGRLERSAREQPRRTRRGP